MRHGLLLSTTGLALFDLPGEDGVGADGAEPLVLWMRKVWVPALSLV